MILRKYIARRKTDGATEKELSFLRQEVEKQAINNATLLLLGVENNPLHQFTELFLHRIRISKVPISESFIVYHLWDWHRIQAGILWENLQNFKFWYNNKDHPLREEMCALLYEYNELQANPDLYFCESVSKQEVAERLRNSIFNTSLYNAESYENHPFAELTE